MAKVTTRVVDGVEHRSCSELARFKGSAASKVQQLIDLYAQHPQDSDVPVKELLENLSLLKRVVSKR
jgi:hypothetical protein